MNIIFFGSDDFAATNLKRLLTSDHQVVACVTQPDKPKGRHLKVSISPIKELALNYQRPVLQPANLKDPDFIKQLEDLKADLFVVIAYGRILPKEVLELPNQFCINVHGSLLPQYRGAAPINWAIINGEPKTGVSVIQMNPQMDAGDVIAQEEILIDREDISITLRSKMADLSAEVLIRTINTIREEDYQCIPQDETAVTYAPKLTKELGLIQWDKTAEEIQNLVRGLLPWPCAYTHFQGKLLKILNTEIVDADPGDYQPGQIIYLSKQGFTVATGKRALLVREVHLESAKPMDANSFMIGHNIQISIQLG